MAVSNHLEHDVAQSSREIFDFFGLPRELRNEIYSMLTHVKTLCHGRNAEGVATQFEASIKSAPIPKAFSLCRQFKAEYEEAFEDGMTLVIRDLWSGMKTPSTAGWPDDITRAQILLLLGCKHGCNYEGGCRIYADLNDHLEWIKDILPQLKELKALEVKIFPCQRLGQNHKSIDITANKVRRVVALPVTSLIEVYPYFSLVNGDAIIGPCEIAGVYEGSRAPVADWRKRDGWQEICGPPSLDVR
jgi:hypothetical protein